MDQSTNRRSLLETEKSAAYEYLCRIEEAKRWIESVIKEELPPATDIEECLRNGVYLCKLGMKIAPDNPDWKRVYDLDQSKFRERGLDFRHTDNINFFLNCLQKLGLPKVFYPAVTDIFEKKNPMKLIYCLHALSHLLHQQGKMLASLTETMPATSLRFTDDDLNIANQTLRSGNVPSFEVVEKLVEEELQYTSIEIYDDEVTEEEDLTAVQNHSPQQVPSGDSDEDEEILFDDPKYVRIAGQGTIVSNTVSDKLSLLPVLENLKCQGVGITATLFPCTSERNSYRSDEFERAIYNINCCIAAGAPLETLRSLQKPSGNLPFPFLEAEDYQQALVEEKEQGFPQNVIIFYSGLHRQLCDTFLDKMRPGAYLLRQSTTLTGGDLVFSFRNEIGIKHWKLNISGDGKFTWGTGNKSFDGLESFLQYFVEALGKVTKLYVYPGIAFMLQLNQFFLTSSQCEILQKLKSLSNVLMYGQLVYVITDVNSRIRRQRATSREGSNCHSPVVNKRSGQEFIIPTDPIVKLNLELLEEDPWNESLLVSVSRSKAEDLLDKEGYPGSFLVRPSEKVHGDYALAFRTRNEIRHWKIVKNDGNYYVHPRPNCYKSVSDIVQHFRDAVGAETGLVMSPLIYQSHGTPSPAGGDHIVDAITGLPCIDPSRTPPPPVHRRESIKREAVMPSPSLSRLNPANITSWSTDDVSSWLIQQSLEDFVLVFQTNCVDGECLMTLDNNLLRDDLCISQLGYRTKIMKKVKTLKLMIHPDL